MPCKHPTNTPVLIRCAMSTVSDSDLRVLAMNVVPSKSRWNEIVPGYLLSEQYGA